MAFSGRVESRFTIPTGGAAASVSTGALSSAVTVTVPAANYFHTSAGGVSSWATTFQTQLNAACTPYPQSASAMSSTLGSGTFSGGAGWMFNIASGNDTGAFGGVTMTVSGSPTYGNGGARYSAHPTDLAVKFSLGTQSFSAGDTYDVTATDDLVVAWVAYFDSAPAATRAFISKYTTTGWFIQAKNNGYYQFGADRVGPANDFLFNGVDVPMPIGAWHVGIAVVDRSTGKARFGVRTLAGTSSVSSEATATAASYANAANLTIGRRADTGTDACTEAYYSAVYVAAGSGVATGLSANLSTALTNFANAINSSFTVSLDTTSLTGRYTISNSFWPFDISWTDTDQRDLAGFDRNITYPQTAAQMATLVGGTWTSGSAWSCNESSGDLAPVFGSVTLADSGTPTYSNQGARGGGDKAVGFDASTEYFDGGDNFDVTATDDLIAVWVARFTSLPGSNVEFLNKNGGGPYWVINFSTGGDHELYLYDGVDSAACTSGAAPTLNKWYVGMAVIDRSTSTMRIGVCDIGGSPAVSATSSTTSIDSLANAAGVRLGAYGGANSFTTGTVAYLAVTTGAGVATGLAAGMSTALASFAAAMKSQTGTKQAKGLFFPDSPLNCDDHPSMAPEDTDLRSTESPTGVVLGLSGNVKYVHANVRWDRVPVDRIREASATYENASLEVFFRDCITGLGGHAWFTPLSKMQVYWSNAGTDTLLGADHDDGEGTSGWGLTTISKFRDIAQPSQPGWVGQFNVRFPRLVSDG
jgi:hypothetical protein